MKCEDGNTMGAFHFKSTSTDEKNVSSASFKLIVIKEVHIGRIVGSLDFDRVVFVSYVSNQ